MTPRVDIVFREEDHSYTVNGKAVPGVTSVLEQTLELMAGIPRHLVEAAADFGRNVHSMCELFDLGVLDEATLDPELVPYLDGYKQFLFDMKPQWTLIETPVASAKIGYAGTQDRYGLIGKTTWEIDIKSSAVAPKTAGPQTAAYNEGLNETYGLRAKKRGCLLLKKQDYVLIPLNDISDWSVFLSCLNIVKWKERFRGRS